MGIAPLFCCFKDCKSISIAITALISNIIAVAILIWGICEVVFRKGIKPVYIIGFILLIISLLAVIGAFILLMVKGSSNFMRIGKILCLIIIVCSILAFILLLIAEIIVIKDYADIEKKLDDNVHIPTKDWCAATIPGILALIASLIIALCANFLYKIFNDDNATQSSRINANQNTTTNINSQIPVPISETNAGLSPLGINAPPIYQNGPDVKNAK